MEIQDTVWGSNPATLEETIRLAAQLTDNHVKDGSLVRKGGKKDSEISTSKLDNEDKSESSSKKRKAEALNYVAVTHAVPISQVAPVFQQAQVRKPYNGIHPLCNACNLHHAANIPCRQCTKCGRRGHTFNFCKEPARAPVNPDKVQKPLAITQGRACFQCGDPSHFRNQCPQLANATRQT